MTYTPISLGIQPHGVGGTLTFACYRSSDYLFIFFLFYYFFFFFFFFFLFKILNFAIFWGVEVLSTIFMGMSIIAGIFGDVIFHGYFWGCQFINVDFIVFLLY